MAKQPKPKFTLLGKSKFVHVARTEAWDRKHSECQTLRKYMVAGKIDYKSKGLSPEAASALDLCPHCDTAGVIAAQETPEQKRERSKAKTEETLTKIRDEHLSNAERKKKARKKKSSPKATAARVKGNTKQRARERSDATQSKAEGLAEFGKEHGWDVDIEPADPGLVLTAVRDAETITCYFVDGKYDVTRHASVSVGDWTGKLRGVHGCRKQMANEGRDRPHPEPGAGRSKPRKKVTKDEDESSPEDAEQRLPFKLDDDDDVILDALLGKVIKWRNGISGSMEEAWLPGVANGSKRPKVYLSEHPKTGKRMINFLTVLSINEDGEQYGPERTVYLERIVRVSG